MSAPMREAIPTYGGSRERLGEPLQTLFSVGTLAGLTDGQLLERFAEGRGAEAEAAFTALVDRHGSMVLGVCRAVLRDEHDAEDALQATFLVLALRAGSIRRGDAVASWLYSVVRRVALRARRQSARQREHERRRADQCRVAEPASTSPVDAWPELHEELDRLPEPFRAVVVLCDLEGHSYEQAAGMLHCPVGTVQSRLARGRQRLRKRLESRGLSSAVVLVNTSAGMTARSATAAVSPRLATAIAKTAVSIAGGQSITAAVPNTVSVLVRTEIRRLFMTRALTGLTTFVMAGLVAAAGIGLVIARQRDDPQPNATTVTKDESVRLIHIRVVDGQENGAPGLPVELIRFDFEPPSSFQTDTEGHVRIPHENARDMIMLLAQRGGKFLAWTMIDDRILNEGAGTKANPIVMKLLALTHRITGSALDRQGKPIPGAEIVVRSLRHPTNRLVVFHAPSHVAYFLRARTDQTGRFALVLPEETDALLSLRHSRYQGQGMAKVNVHIVDPMIVEPTGTISGKVIDAATGRPVVGVIMTAQLIQHHKQTLEGWGDIVTDDQGRFVIIGLEPGVYNLLFEKARGRVQATARAVEGLRVRVGADTAADLVVMDGRTLRGVVIDQETNQPVAGVLVGCYGPARPQAGGTVQNDRTDKQGRFTFYLPPGKQYVYIMDGSPSSRLSSRTVVLPDQGEIEPVRLLRTKPAINSTPYANIVQLKATERTKPPAPGANIRTVTGRVRDPLGRPVLGVNVSINPNVRFAGRDPESFNSDTTDREGTFILQGLPRRELKINLNRLNAPIQTEALSADRDTVEWTYRPALDSQ